MMKEKKGKENQAGTKDLTSSWTILFVTYGESWLMTDFLFTNGSSSHSYKENIIV
jgi:hypothetical protein